MKRIKIMLMTICLVAVVGGIIAFKAMNVEARCTASTTTNAQGQPTCPALCPNISNIIIADIGTLICTGSTTVGTNGGISCTYTTDPPGPVTITTVTQSCVSTTRKTADEGE